MKRIYLRDARRRAKLTQTELANKSGIDQTYISKLEVGKIVNPGFETVVDLAAALDIDPRSLRFGHRTSTEAIAS